MILYINCANHATGVKFCHSQGVDSLHRLTIGKYSNISISKGSQRILIKLYSASLGSRKGCLLFLGRSDLNSGCHGNIYVLMGGGGSIIFFSESSSPTALIFGMWQWLTVIHLNCANHSPRGKFCHRLTTIGKPSISLIGSLYLCK